MVIKNVGFLKKVPPRMPIQSVVDNKIDIDKNIFQTALDRAVTNLNNISAQELEADKLITEYVNGKASMEDVVIGVEKANLGISLALTVINTTVQTVKEIMQMPV